MHSPVILTSLPLSVPLLLLLLLENKVLLEGLDSEIEAPGKYQNLKQLFMLS